jgi:hypothetical protein
MSNVFYWKGKENDQNHTETLLGYDAHHFITTNQSIPLKSF